MLDIFDILGPVMVGPSSSHTAGAVRIGSMARTLLGDEPVEARIHLHGSFAETGPGHGTDRALVAGLLGMKPDDLRIPFAFQEAKKRGLIYTIDTVELRDAHPNTAVIETWDAGGKKLELQACSVGGGRILVNKVDAPNPDYAVDNRKNVTNWFDGELDESCWSVKDNMAAAMADPKAGPILKQIREKAAASRGDVAAAVKDNPALVAMMERAMQRMTIQSMLMQAGTSEEDIKQLNRVLQGISKE